LPSKVSSHPLHLVGSLPQSLAKNHLPCLSKSNLPSPVQCHLLSPARCLPLTLVISHLPSQTMKHPQSLVRSHLPSPTKSHLPRQDKSLITPSTNASSSTSLPSLPHVTSTLHSLSLTHVYHTSCPKFFTVLLYTVTTNVVYPSPSTFSLHLPQIASSINPVFPYPAKCPIFLQHPALVFIN
jgi:hypothetical protein